MVGDWITSVRWNKEDGFKCYSGEVKSIYKGKKDTTINAPKAFYPIHVSEYEFAPNEEYPQALADYYYGAEPLTVDMVNKQVEELNKR